MFREMRRNKQQMSREDSIAVLERGTSGVLAVAGDDGYPYAVPLSYVYAEGKIFFHCAATGHKMDAIARCDKASFCVVDQDEVVPEKYTTFFRSVIAFGRVRTIEDPERKRAAIELLAERYSPGRPGSTAKEIDGAFSRLCMLEMEIEHLTGKEAVEIVRAKAEGR